MFYFFFLKKKAEDDFKVGVVFSGVLFRSGLDPFGPFKKKPRRKISECSNRIQPAAIRQRDCENILPEPHGCRGGLDRACRRKSAPYPNRAAALLAVKRRAHARRL